MGGQHSKKEGGGSPSPVPQYGGPSGGGYGGYGGYGSYGSGGTGGYGGGYGGAASGGYGGSGAYGSGASGGGYGSGGSGSGSGGACSGGYGGYGGGSGSGGGYGSSGAYGSGGYSGYGYGSGGSSPPRPKTDSAEAEASRREQFQNFGQKFRDVMLGTGYNSTAGSGAGSGSGSYTPSTSFGPPPVCGPSSYGSGSSYGPSTYGSSKYTSSFPSTYVPPATFGKESPLDNYQSGFSREMPSKGYTSSTYKPSEVASKYPTTYNPASYAASHEWTTCDYGSKASPPMGTSYPREWGASDFSTSTKASPPIGTSYPREWSGAPLDFNAPTYTRQGYRPGYDMNTSHYSAPTYTRPPPAYAPPAIPSSGPTYTRSWPTAGPTYTRSWPAEAPIVSAPTYTRPVEGFSGFPPAGLSAYTSSSGATPQSAAFGSYTGTTPQTYASPSEYTGRQFTFDNAPLGSTMGQPLGASAPQFPSSTAIPTTMQGGIMSSSGMGYPPLGALPSSAMGAPMTMPSQDLSNPQMPMQTLSNALPMSATPQSLGGVLPMNAMPQSQQPGLPSSGSGFGGFSHGQLTGLPSGGSFLGGFSQGQPTGLPSGGSGLDGFSQGQLTGLPSGASVLGGFSQGQLSGMPLVASAFGGQGLPQFPNSNSLAGNVATSAPSNALQANPFGSTSWAPTPGPEASVTGSIAAMSGLSGGLAPAPHFFGPAFGQAGQAGMDQMVSIAHMTPGGLSTATAPPVTTPGAQEGAGQQPLQMAGLPAGSMPAFGAVPFGAANLPGMAGFGPFLPGMPMPMPMHVQMQMPMHMPMPIHGLQGFPAGFAALPPGFPGMMPPMGALFPGAFPGGFPIVSGAVDINALAAAGLLGPGTSTDTSATPVLAKGDPAPPMTALPPKPAAKSAAPASATGSRNVSS